MLKHCPQKIVVLLKIKDKEPVYFLEGNGEKNLIITRKDIMGCRILGEGKVFMIDQRAKGIATFSEYFKIFVPKPVTIKKEKFSPVVPTSEENPIVVEVIKNV